MRAAVLTAGAVAVITAGELALRAALGAGATTPWGAVALGLPPAIATLAWGSLVAARPARFVGAWLTGSAAVYLFPSAPVAATWTEVGVLFAAGLASVLTANVAFEFVLSAITPGAPARRHHAPDRPGHRPSCPGVAGAPRADLSGRGAAGAVVAGPRRPRPPPRAVGQRDAGPARHPALGLDGRPAARVLGPRQLDRCVRADHRVPAARARARARRARRAALPALLAPKVLRWGIRTTSPPVLARLADVLPAGTRRPVSLLAAETGHRPWRVRESVRRGRDGRFFLEGDTVRRAPARLVDLRTADPDRPRLARLRAVVPDGRNLRAGYDAVYGALDERRARLVKDADRTGRRPVSLRLTEWALARLLTEAPRRLPVLRAVHPLLVGAHVGRSVSALARASGHDPRAVREAVTSPWSGILVDGDVVSLPTRADGALIAQVPPGGRCRPGSEGRGAGARRGERERTARRSSVAGHARAGDPLRAELTATAALLRGVPPATVWRRHLAALGVPAAPCRGCPCGCSPPAASRWTR